MWEESGLRAHEQGRTGERQIWLLRGWRGGEGCSGLCSHPQHHTASVRARMHCWRCHWRCYPGRAARLGSLVVQRQAHPCQVSIHPTRGVPPLLCVRLCAVRLWCPGAVSESDLASASQSALEHALGVRWNVLWMLPGRAGASKACA